MIDCPKCGMTKEAHETDRHLCVDCVKAINSRITYYRQHQDWMAAAKENGVDTWLQQPGETQWEYTVWLAYRDSYPGKKPSYSSVAQQLGTTYNAVNKIAQRWSFQARMQEWMAECDRITMLQRHTEIIEMNKDHVDMAARLRQKMSVAIDRIDPHSVSPRELATLLKMSTELERKARIDTAAYEEVRSGLVVDTENPNLKKASTSQGDLAEVVQILMKAGALKSVTALGVKETTTTTREVVAKDDSTMVIYEGETDG